MTDQPTKRCPRCGEEKPLSEFYLRKNYSYTANGAISNRPGQPVTGACKDCAHAARRANHQKARERQKAANAQHPPVVVPPLGGHGLRGTRSFRYYRMTQDILRNRANTRTDP
jgi:hypothetical protein